MEGSHLRTMAFLWEGLFGSSRKFADPKEPPETAPLERISIGRGKIMVEFFSAEMAQRVCR